MASDLQRGQRHLLLLYPTPLDLTRQSLSKSYESTLEQVLQQLSRSTRNTQRPRLDIAVHCPTSSEPDYERCQHLMGSIFSLVCHLCLRLSIDVQYDNDIDCQVLLFHFGPLTDIKPTIKSHQRFPNLIKLAHCGILWSQVFVSESEPGEEVLNLFMTNQSALSSQLSWDPQVVKVPAGLGTVTPLRPQIETLSPTSKPWSDHCSVAVGGTFDHLHIGHRLLLAMTALVLSPVNEGGHPRRLTVGITGDDLLKNKKYVEEMEDWNTRQSHVRGFLLGFLALLSSENHLLSTEVASNAQSRGRATLDRLQSGIQISYVEIFDPFGPTVTDPEISALVISGETRSGGSAVNEKRAEHDWRPLEIFEVDVLHPVSGEHEARQDAFQGKISSTDIRSRLHQHRVTAGKGGRDERVEPVI